MNKYHNFSPDVIENLVPFERDLYQDMIIADIEKAEHDAAHPKQQGVEYAFG